MSLPEGNAAAAVLVGVRVVEAFVEEVHSDDTAGKVGTARAVV